MSAGRSVWVKIRAGEAERAEWHAKARSAGLTLSDPVRRSVGRVRTWTVAHAEVERKRPRELARLGNILNQIARWANSYKAAAEAVEVVPAHLVAIRRAPGADARREPGSRCTLGFSRAAAARPGRRPTTCSGGTGLRRRGVRPRDTCRILGRVPAACGAIRD